MGAKAVGLGGLVAIGVVVVTAERPSGGFEVGAFGGCVDGALDGTFGIIAFVGTIVGWDLPDVGAVNAAAG